MTYSTEDNEDRIREDIFRVLEEKDEVPLSELIDQIKGNDTVISEVVKRMINENLIQTFKGETGKKGRKPLILKLK